MLIPKEVKELIQGDERLLWLFMVLGLVVAFFIGCELVCLFIIGKVLLGQALPVEDGGLFLYRYFENFSQSQLLILLGSIFAGVVVIRYVSQLLYYHLSFKWSSNVMGRLQNRMMESILSAPTSVLDKLKLGENMHALMEAPYGATFAVDAITMLIASLYTVLLVCLTLVFISPWLILAAILFGIPLFWLISKPLQGKVRALKSQFIEQRKPSMEMGANIINSIRDIKSLSTESQMAATFSHRVTIALTAFARARFIKMLPAPTLQTIFQFGFAVVIIITGLLLSPEMMAGFLPSLGAIMYGFFRVYPAISQVIKSRLEFYNAIPDLQVTAKLTKLPQDCLAGGSQSYPTGFDGIRFEEVSFSYDGAVPVLADLNVFIEAGKVTGFVGGSGSGKSTLIDLMLKFLTPERGKISLGEQNLNDVLRNSWLQNVGVVRQDVFLFAGTIRENFVAWKIDATEKEILFACKQSGALDFIKDLPEGLDTVVGDRGVTISGGQRQRIAIARALLRNPEVLILDEALSALDGETETRVLQSLIDGSPDRTIILVSHRLASIERADHIIVMANGRIVEQGNHDELKALRGRYTELFSTQMRLSVI